MYRMLAIEGIILLLSLLVGGGRSYGTSVSRRGCLRQVTASVVGVSFGGWIGAEDSMAAESVGGAIRQSMSNVPGYGQADIVYPDYFEGKWKLVRTQFPINAQEDPRIYDYEVRFVRKEFGVVADRGFNEANRYMAINNDSSFVRQKSWDVSNPNVLTLSFRDGTSKEMKVTRRSTELSGNASSLNDWGLSSSEFLRVSDVGNNGIPIISTIHILSKWKPGTDQNTIEGIELEYDEGNLGDPMSFASPQGGAGGPQKSKLKSRLRMTRLS